MPTTLPRHYEGPHRCCDDRPLSNQINLCEIVEKKGCKWGALLSFLGSRITCIVIKLEHNQLFLHGRVSWGIFLLLIEVVRIAATPRRSGLQRQRPGSIISLSNESVEHGLRSEKKSIKKTWQRCVTSQHLWAACHRRALPWRGSWHVVGLKQRAHCLTLECCISVAWAPLCTLISNARGVDLRPFGWIEREPVRQCEMGNEPVCPDLLCWLLMWTGINGLFRSEISEPDQWDGRRRAADQRPEPTPAAAFIPGYTDLKNEWNAPNALLVSFSLYTVTMLTPPSLLSFSCPCRLHNQRAQTEKQHPF